MHPATGKAIVKVLVCGALERFVKEFNVLKSEPAINLPPQIQVELHRLNVEEAEEQIAKNLSQLTDSSGSKS
jgi:hypothetical protein